MTWLVDSMGSLFFVEAKVWSIEWDMTGKGFGGERLRREEKGENAVRM